MIEFFSGYEGYASDWLWEMGLASLGTLQLMFVSFWLACAIGMVVALVRMSPFWILQHLAKLYIGFFRGVPVLVILYWIYFALPEMGYEILVISSYTAAVLGPWNPRRRLHGGDLPFRNRVPASGPDGGGAFRRHDPGQRNDLHHPAPGDSRRTAADRQLTRSVCSRKRRCARSSRHRS